MQIRSLAAGVLAGLVLGGVAWAHHDAVEGVTYLVHAFGRGEASTRNLTVAQGWFAEQSDSLDSGVKAGLRESVLVPVELIERTCTSRVLASHHR